MTKIPTKPEDFFWPSGKGTLREALQFLIDTRNYVAQLQVPEGIPYRQIAHSGDKKTVGGDHHRPAVLDASYEHFKRWRLSISVPIFTPAQDIAEVWERKLTLGERLKMAIHPETKIDTQMYKINTGFTAPNLQECFLKLLDSYGIKTDMPKVGYYEPARTVYIETTLENPADFNRGRCIIQAYVHGQAQTPEELERDINKALNAPSGPKDAFRL